jgi:hypothetical protein
MHKEDCVGENLAEAGTEICMAVQQASDMAFFFGKQQIRRWPCAGQTAQELIDKAGTCVHSSCMVLNYITDACFGHSNMQWLNILNTCRTTATCHKTSSCTALCDTTTPLSAGQFTTSTVPCWMVKTHAGTFQVTYALSSRKEEATSSWKHPLRRSCSSLGLTWHSQAKSSASTTCT